MSKAKNRHWESRIIAHVLRQTGYVGHVIDASCNKDGLGLFLSFDFPSHLNDEVGKEDYDAIDRFIATQDARIANVVEALGFKDYGAEGHSWNRGNERSWVFAEACPYGIETHEIDPHYRVMTPEELAAHDDPFEDWVRVRHAGINICRFAAWADEVAQ